MPITFDMLVSAGFMPPTFIPHPNTVAGHQCIKTGVDTSEMTPEEAFNAQLSASQFLKDLYAAMDIFSYEDYVARCMDPTPLCATV